MPFREKFAWLSLIAMAVTMIPYFAITAANPPGNGLPDLGQLALYAKAAIARMIILGVGRMVLARRSPEDAKMPADERDRAIAHGARTWAYYVLLLGMIPVGGIMPFYAGGWHIVNATIFMIVLSEVVHYGAVVAGYRRQV